MNGRLKLIEQQLLGIDSATYQNLCDTYFYLRENDLASINRLGSQLGKQKTVKGTPDTFFRLSDGRLCYAEYTTTSNQLVEKIKNDIDKCLDSTLTGVPTNEIHKIIICFNSKLKLEEEVIVIQYANSKSIRIELIDLGRLAIEILSKYLILAKEFLGIPLDTGQLNPILKFINEYNNKAGKLSTPLDNIFLHRIPELAEIENVLNSNNILIISGTPGVGKTKIALEALNKFLSENNDYSAFAVSKKDQDISDDLKILLQQDENYVLLVDDANRQLLNFKQILGIFKENRKGNIKLIITVRDYALNDVINECFEFDPNKLILNKFTDEEIIGLIGSDSFKITKWKYQKKTVEIADGNARLAVMAARLANEKQESFLYGDVSYLYDSYFQTFIKDFDLFGDKILLKTLGLISFFFSIDRNDKKLIDSILESFEIEYHEFNEAINELEKRELVEVLDNNVRVSEQVMATYFFYRVFIKDELLSFRTLLFDFFTYWENRFLDTIIPSTNSFGYENVFNKINSSLNDYLYSIYSDEEKVLKFFKIFLFYKREEVLKFYYQKIKNFPEPENPIYNSKYEQNDFVFNKDNTLENLSDIFKYYTESFIPSLELSFEYCRKQPNSLPELIRRIREKLLFDEYDQNNNFQRQVEFLDFIITKFKEKQPHFIEAFFALSVTFLSHYFQITKGGRKNSISVYQYPLPFYDVTINFRKSIWITLFENYEVYPKEIFSIIKKYNTGYIETNIEILEFDLSLLLPFIEDKLTKTSFTHIHFVHEFVSMLDREKLNGRSYQKLKFEFNSTEYEYFRKIDWNRHRGKQDYDFNNYEEFEKLKEQDIRKTFVFKNPDEFIELHKAIKNILTLEGNNTFGIEQSLNIIVEENFNRNEELGFQLLESILQAYPTGVNTLYLPIKTIINKSNKWALRLWKFLTTWNHEYKIYWQLTFFSYLPEEYSNCFYKSELILTIKSINRHCFLDFESYEKFISIKSNKLEDKILKYLSTLPFFKWFIKYTERNFFEELLSIIYQKVEKEKINITISNSFFVKYSKLLENNFGLLSGTYIQQEKAANYFDHDRIGLKSLVEINPKFLHEYLNVFYNEDELLHNHDTHNQLQFVWELENYEILIEDAANLIIENVLFIGISDHPLIIFFHNLNKEQEKKAKEFLLIYISKYNRDKNKMDAIFDVLRHVLKDFYEEAFMHYLALNTELDDFENISWIGNGGVYHGEVIIGEIKAKSWQNILRMADKSKDQLNLIPIRTFIKKTIEDNLKAGDEERKRKFKNPNGYNF